MKTETMSMLDPNLKEFYARVGRVQVARRKGYGFEAPGTLGRSHYTKLRHKRRFGVVKPLCLLALCAFGTKGTIHYYVGAQTYETRVEALSRGEGFDRLGGALMKADPVTLWVSGTMKRHLSTGV